ncbi:MAG: glucan 1,4-alpha-glucosidase [Symploca sp. SIO2C1]|nr:glucan 1,4-alpha-glucosidase [Symploca sp. SIO2C1]
MNLKRWLLVYFIVLCAAWLLGTNVAWAAGGGQAPGAPGNTSVWSYAGKQGIGTSYEQYVNKTYQDDGPTNTISKVWFSLAQGIVTETAFGEIDQAQIKDLQFLVTGNGFFDEEKVATNSSVDYLDKDSSGRPLSPAYRVVNQDKDGKYTIEKHVFTDPDRQTLFTRVIFTANEDNVTPYILVNPHMGNIGNDDVAFVSGDSLNARNGADNVYLSLKSNLNFEKTSAGYVGSTDGYQDLNDNGFMDWTYDYTDQNRLGNVAMMAQLPTLNAGETRTFDLVVGFGSNYEEATAQADASLNEGYESLLAKYNGTGSAVGWEDYLASLSNLPAMIANTGDNGKELYASALVLKIMEDKNNAGALIASLSVPWGDTINADTFATGYRAVWPRDFYQVAMAFLALGDTQTPLVAFEYLPKVQVKSSTPGNNGATGWFLQKTHVDGTLEWIQVQLDQTAMPIMLGWKLWQAGILSDSEITNWYNLMLKPAAEFLANGGNVNINSNQTTITPPFTQQERWEEQAGYSPSTTAATITGLLTAADIAQNAANDPGAASFYFSKADQYQSNLDNFMFTTNGTDTFCSTPGQYFLRITPNANPNDGGIYPGGIIGASNGLTAIDERNVIDGGFLELVRYGVTKGNDPNIVASVCTLDNITTPEDLRVRYDFTFDGNQYPGFRRYGHDGYGERTNDGGSYLGGAPNQRGRVWPFFTGERGHYELAKVDNEGTISDAEVTQLRDTYVRGMEYFANDSFMLAEQVWDGVGSNETYNYALGEGTNSATPLAWTHAEYIKLVKSLTDKNIWDSYEIVKARYQSE